jgi:hypothetical protein
MKRRYAGAAAAGLSGLTLLTGCGSSRSAAPDTAATPPRTSDASVKADFLRGVAQIRGSPDERRLRGQLEHTVARLRSDRGSTEVGQRARSEAIQGFAWALKGIESELDLIANDSGNINAAVRDAKRADRRLKKGANLLRAAGRAFSIRLGRLNGH